MSSHVPGEIPVGRLVRQAVQTDGATWSTNDADSTVPSPPPVGSTGPLTTSCAACSCIR
jgi:hypothetical protein